jgi:hypothetical protein
VLGSNDLEAVREDLNGWLIVIVLREASLASLAAGGAPQVFVPLVSHGRKVKRVSLVCRSGAGLSVLTSTADIGGMMPHVRLGALKPDHHRHHCGAQMPQLDHDLCVHPTNACWAGQRQ